MSNDPIAPPAKPTPADPETPAAQLEALQAKSRIQVSQTRSSIHTWRGQFPPPDAIERYEQILPGAFDRMITMAEKAQDANIKTTGQANLFMQQDTRRGHVLGFVVSLLGMAGAFASVQAGYTIVALAFLSVPVMGLARAFVDRRVPEPQTEPPRSDPS